MTTAYTLAACPVCNGSDVTELASREAIRRELESLWSFHTRRLRPGTPTRHLNDRLVFSQDPPLRLVRCNECGTVYRNPRERAETVTDLYSDEPLDDAVLDSLFRTQRAAYRAQARRLTRVAGRPGSGIELGSYVGGFLAAARELGWRFDGVDINASAIRFARNRGFAVRHGSLTEVEGEGKFDAIAIWNCFDQLPDPRAVVDAAGRLLRQRGVLAIRVPNGAFYAWLSAHAHGPFRRSVHALLAHNNLLAFPYLHGFTPASLTRLLEGAGMRVVRIHGDTLVPLADRWTRAWARWEERLLKGAVRRSAPARRSPWFEIYARR